VGERWSAWQFMHVLSRDGQVWSTQVEYPAMLPRPFLERLPEDATLRQHREVRAGFGRFDEAHDGNSRAPLCAISWPEILPDLLWCGHGHWQDAVFHRRLQVVEKVVSRQHRR